MREACELMDEERYLFYIAITRAKERLYLTYPSTNSDGNMTLPSFFLSDIRKMFSQEVLQNITIRRNLSRIIPGPEEIVNPTDVKSYVYYHLNCPYTPAGGPRDKDLALWLYNSDENKDHFRKGLCELKNLVDSYWDLKPRLYDKSIIKKIKDLSTRFTPTKLKDYAQCPYKYFSGFTLDLRQISPASLDLLMQGRIIHMVLEEYFKGSKENNISQIFAEIFSRETKGTVIGFEELKIRNEMLNTLLAFESRERDNIGPKFKPFMFEEKFGDEDHGPITIEDSKMGCIEISGKIDRVDVSEVNGERAGIIIDYKSGKTGFKLTDIEEGTDLQLPIYILALRDVFKITPVAAEFYALKTLERTGIFNRELITNLGTNQILSKKSVSIDTEQFKKLLEDTKEHILRFIGEIRKGNIVLKPHNLDLCGEGNCDYANVCRVDKWRVG